MTLTCSVEGPDGFRYDWSRDSKDSPGETFPFVYESDIVISQGGSYTCRGWSNEPYVITPKSDAVFIEETGEFSIFQRNKQPTVFMFLNKAHSVEGK